MANNRKPHFSTMKLICLLSAAAWALFACGSAAAGTVNLKKAWVQKYKDRATIEATFRIDDAHPQPNTGKKDGDLHIAGASLQVGIPTVAEIMNAKDVTSAVQTVHDNKGSSVSVVGAWRLWFEHPPKADELQAQNLVVLPTPKAGTNPDHMFEIHPLASINGIPLGATFKQIQGFKTKEAADSFRRYNNLTAAVRADDQGITIDSPKIGFNYVEFWFEAKAKPKAMKDGGRVVMADVFAADSDDPVAEDIRMIFVPGTAPFAKVSSIESGAEVHVLGIPRVNLNAIFDFAFSSANDGQRRALPYEIIIVGVYPN